MKDGVVIKFNLQLREAGPDDNGGELHIRGPKAQGLSTDGQELLSNEPRSFVDDFPEVFLEFEID